MRKFILTCAALVWSTTASAATFVYDYIAEFDRVIVSDPTIDTVVDSIQSMTELTGTLTLNDTVVDTGPTGIAYEAPILTIDGFDLSPTRGFSAFGVQKFPTFDDISGSTAVPSASSLLQDVNFIFRDHTGTALSNFDVPVPIDIGDFDRTILLFYANQTGASALDILKFERVDYRFTSLTLRPVAAIPLPASLPFLLFGAMTLVWAGRRSNNG